MPLSRRSFLTLAAGGVVLAACGGDSDSVATEPGEEAATGDLVAVRFFPDGVLAAGQRQRVPIGLGDGSGVLTTGGPEQLTATVTDAAGAEVATAIATRHADGLPRPYWPLAFELTQPGVYTAAIDTGSGVASLAFSVTEPAAIAVPKPGDPMVPVETPTTADGRGVNPICTREPACPLHEITLTEALQRGTPVAFLVATPAFCQTAACGPVVDVLTAQRQAFPGVTMVHAEVYTDTTIETTSPAVDAYRLPFEPVLYLAGADGVIRSRLDSIFDGAELAPALAALA